MIDKRIPAKAFEAWLSMGRTQYCDERAYPNGSHMYELIAQYDAQVLELAELRECKAAWETVERMEICVNHCGPRPHPFADNWEAISELPDSAEDQTAYYAATPMAAVQAVPEEEPDE